MVPQATRQKKHTEKKHRGRDVSYFQKFVHFEQSLPDLALWPDNSKRLCRKAYSDPREVNICSEREGIPWKPVLRQGGCDRMTRRRETSCDSTASVLYS